MPCLLWPHATSKMSTPGQFASFPVSQLETTRLHGLFRNIILLNPRLSSSVIKPNSALLMTIIAFLKTTNLQFSHFLPNRVRSGFMYITPCIRSPRPQFGQAFSRTTPAVTTLWHELCAVSAQKVFRYGKTALCYAFCLNTHGHWFRIPLRVCFTELLNNALCYPPSNY